MLKLPIRDEDLEDPLFYHPGHNSEEVRYMMERRRVLHGCLPKRAVRSKPLPKPEDKVFAEFMLGTKENQLVSTTIVTAKLIRNLLRDPA